MPDIIVVAASPAFRRCSFLMILVCVTYFGAGDGVYEAYYRLRLTTVI